jgi:D-serine deaminase-like pyridoxal phosphate-dependent protein
VRQGKTIVLMIDSAEHAEHLEVIAAAEGVTLPVCLDLDMALDLPGLHFGVWRSSVRSVDDALRVFAAIERCKHLRLDGVMGYEAQIAGVGDNVPKLRAKNTLVRLLQRRSVRIVAERRATVVRALAERGAQLRFVNGGGTGSLESTTRQDVVTEVTVGSAFFAPTLFDQYRAFRYLPAAGFAIEIVRRPRWICTPAWVAAMSHPAAPGPRSCRVPTYQTGRHCCHSKARVRYRRRSATAAPSAWRWATPSSCAIAKPVNSASTSIRCCWSWLAAL